MTVYADTSALAKLVIEEEGSPEMRAVQETSETIASAAIAYVELRAAAAAALRNNRVPADERDGLVGSIEDLWVGVSSVPVTTDLLSRAAGLAEQMRLRAYDAVHLAALLASGSNRDVSFACFDVDLRTAARSLGYALYPA